MKINFLSSILAHIESHNRAGAAHGFLDVTPVLAVGPTPERAAEFIVEMGPVGAHMRDADDVDVAQVVRAVADAYRGEDPSPRRAGAWLVSATAH